MSRQLQVAFALGVLATEHVHKVGRKGNQILTDAIYKTLQDVANGELTLLNTPQETVADLPPPAPELVRHIDQAELERHLIEEMSGAIPQLIREHRQIAAEILRQLPPLR